MRVKFNRDYAVKGEPSYAKGSVVDLDDGLAQQLVNDGVAKAFPRTAAEVAEQAAKYYPGDENRTPAQLAERVPQVVALAGDTRTATEVQLGEDDPHKARAELISAAKDAAEKKAAAEEKDAAAAKPAAEQSPPKRGA